jgi:predicted glycoside hydrolase/deacetylase ChbG (UPF0249 family)
MAKKQIILCADDYAQSESVSEGILALAEQKRLSAISCMTQSSLWPFYAKALNNFVPKLDIGLHFNLTHVFTEKAWSLPPLIARSLTRTLPRLQIKKTLNNQLTLFEDKLGKTPDFVDGHHHVHCFPQIRQVVLETLLERYTHQKPYLRIPSPPLTKETFSKSLILRFLSAGFKEEAFTKGFAFPPHFAGVSYFTHNNPAEHYMKKNLENSLSGTLLMCHPAISANTKEKDAIEKARQQEFIYLASHTFLDFMQNHHIELVRFQDLL